MGAVKQKRTLSHRARIYLAYRNITAKQFADELGIHDSLLSLVLHGKRRPKPWLVEKLTAAIGATSREFGR